MKLKLTNERTASQTEIAELEQRIGEALPSAFIEFVARHDGAKPETNRFKVGTSNNSGINEFISVKEIPKRMSCIENLPDRSFPVAWAEGGNYVFVNLATGGEVYFWDHEQPEKITKVANSFGSFLEMLEPFDIKTIKLEPGQVKKVWVDPDFLKSLKG